MKHGTILIGYCVEGKHHVPRDQMTKLSTSKPGIFRVACIACQERVIDARAAVKNRLKT